MLLPRILLMLIPLLFAGICKASGDVPLYYPMNPESPLVNAAPDSKRPGPVFKLSQFSKKALRLNRKATAALLAFPFPFGIVGLHRIYLGCAPYVPVVYIASLGGVFGILPLVDFLVILSEKDVEQFANSGKVFMWVE